MDAFEALFKWLESLWTDFIEFVTYIPIELLDLLLTAISSLVTSIPVPDFASNGLSMVVGELPPTVRWAMDQSGFTEALVIIGAGVVFRMLRKIFTLGQW